MRCWIQRHILIDAVRVVWFDLLGQLPGDTPGHARGRTIASNASPARPSREILSERSRASSLITIAAAASASVALVSARTASSCALVRKSAWLMLTSLIS